MNERDVIKFFLGDVNVIDFSHFAGQAIIAKIENDEGEIEIFSFNCEWLGYAKNTNESDFSTIPLD